jgi:predicted DsbA family dithiol-disulfide isomerase
MSALLNVVSIHGMVPWFVVMRKSITVSSLPAYFVDAKNIGDPKVLVEIATAVGLPADKAREVIEKRTHKEAIDADWQKSHQYGVTGVPTFVAGQRGVVGAQPYEALEELVRQAKG